MKYAHFAIFYSSCFTGVQPKHKGVGTGLADQGTAGPKFPVHQENPQLIIYVNCNQATLKFYFTAAGLY